MPLFTNGPPIVMDPGTIISSTRPKRIEKKETKPTRGFSFWAGEKKDNNETSTQKVESSSDVFAGLEFM